MGWDDRGSGEAGDGFLKGRPVLQDKHSEAAVPFHNDILRRFPHDAAVVSHTFEVSHFLS